MQERTQKVSIGEKIGYSLGDGAGNFVFQAVIFFQMVYFTNVMGIDPNKAGTLLFLVMIWNAVFDVIMGVIADKTSTKMGKFRPWILWSALPFGLVFYLTYMTPDVAEGAKMAWATIIYFLLWTIYSVNNIPYSALGGVITGDVVERTSIASYRQVTAMAAAAIIQGFFISMVTHFGNGNPNAPQGWRITVGIFAGVAVLFHLLTFFTTKERIVPKKEAEASTKEAFSDLLKNGPWIATFIATLFIFTNLAQRGGTLYYYFTNYLNPESLQSFISTFGYRVDDVTAVGKAFELFNMSGMAFTIVGIVLSNRLAKKFGKRNIFVLFLALATIFCAVFGLVSPTNTIATFLINIGQTFSFGITIPLLWSMIGDVADFSEWKFNRRATGVVFAGIVFALKFGLGFGQKLNGLFLTQFGYDSHNVTETAVHGIRLMASYFPAAMFLISIISLLFYKIDKNMEHQIQDELEARKG